MKGWVSISRAMKLNWVWEDKPFSKGQAWVDLLLSAQHTEKKLPTKTDFIKLKRGELLTQERTLMNNWGWSKTKVRSFLTMLEKDLMIVRKKDQNKTVLSICNYNSYQDDETKKEPKKDQNKTKTKPKKDLCNNDNNENNENNNIFNFKKSFIDLGVNETTLSDWLKVRAKKKSANTETAFKGLLTRIEKSGLTPNECILHSAENSWSGFNIDWVDTLKGNNNQKQNLRTTEGLNADFKSGI